MKIVCISDTHTRLHKVEVPDGDVLIHAGDWLGRGTTDEFFEFRAALSKLPHKHKIIVAGNHDRLAQRSPNFVRDLLEEDPTVTYLQDESITIEGIKFYGSPWQPEYKNWAFGLPRGEALAKKWAGIPEDVNVLVTHCPPHGILDLLDDNETRIGCEELAKKLSDLKDLKLHVFGHIHHSHGGLLSPNPDPGRTGPMFVNASICTEEYKPTNKPIVIELVI